MEPRLLELIDKNNIFIELDNNCSLNIKLEPSKKQYAITVICLDKEVLFGLFFPLSFSVEKVIATLCFILDQLYNVSLPKKQIEQIATTIKGF